MAETRPKASAPQRTASAASATLLTQQILMRVFTRKSPVCTKAATREADRFSTTVSAGKGRD